MEDNSSKRSSGNEDSKNEDYFSSKIHLTITGAFFSAALCTEYGIIAFLVAGLLGGVLTVFISYNLRKLDRYLSTKTPKV